MSGNERVHLDKALADLHAKGLYRDGACQVSDLLLTTSHRRHLFWLARGLVHQVARAIECHRSHLDWSPNPLEGDRIWGGRADIALTTHLSMGLGGEDAGSDPTPFVEANVKHYLRLRKRHRKWGKKLKPAKPSAQRGVSMILSRYLATSQQFFSVENCSNIVISCDASRVGGREVLLVALLGTSHSGDTRVCWAPLQIVKK